MVDQTWEKIAESINALEEGSFKLTAEKENGVVVFLLVHSISSKSRNQAKSKRCYSVTILFGG